MGKRNEISDIIPNRTAAHSPGWTLHSISPVCIPCDTLSWWPAHSSPAPPSLLISSILLQANQTPENQLFNYHTLWHWFIYCYCELWKQIHIYLFWEFHIQTRAAITPRRWFHGEAERACSLPAVSSAVTCLKTKVFTVVTGCILIFAEWTSLSPRVWGGWKVLSPSVQPPSCTCKSVNINDGRCLTLRGLEEGFFDSFIHPLLLMFVIAEACHS